ncbi:hypothetical protein CONLIGDRAFT_394604 [Coniochaeta ligniaria NRRL 30616]|uniref:Uncharacterized protein n=1 Tax=Coniochaeta ligniaria NRRL 30616 TaxID=1408157 RepID=A0A1J7JGL1_9PEZI|nr:hypothetical protein CONLIGDRAFT_394604 [Coniochaeta ligniaria NRRL 30616]
MQGVTSRSTTARTVGGCDMLTGLIMMPWMLLPIVVGVRGVTKLSVCLLKCSLSLLSLSSSNNLKRASGVIFIALFWLSCLSWSTAFRSFLHSTVLKRFIGATFGQQVLPSYIVCRASSQCCLGSCGVETLADGSSKVYCTITSRTTRIAGCNTCSCTRTPNHQALYHTLPHLSSPSASTNTSPQCN